MQEYICAIDIGTTKICVLTAQVTYDGLGQLSLHLLGEGVAPSRGIRRGVVVDVPEATAAIGEAIQKCEQDAGRPILSAYVGIAGSHISTRNSRGVSPVDRRSGVTSADMQRALEGARAVVLPENQAVIHTLARTWTVDGETEVQQPIGVNAHRLEVDAHIVTGSSTAIHHLVQCEGAHGIDIDELVLEPLAANEAVLRPEERRMGVAVVDMGGGTSDLALFLDSALTHTAILDMGGNHLTNDVAVGLRCSFETAEEIKLRYGSLLPERVAPDETVWASVFGEKAERSFSRRFICDVLEARAAEMIETLAEKLTENGWIDRLPAGVVLTGGCSQLPGFAELGRSTLGMPVRIGAAQNSLPIAGLTRTLLTPSYATSVGLLLWGLHEDARSVHQRYQADHGNSSRQKWMGAAARWLKTLLPDRD